MNILIVDDEKSSLAELKNYLEAKGNINLSLTSSTKEALQLCSKRGLDIAIFAENLINRSGLDFIKEIVPINPFLNCALQSPLEADDFHEVTEGYGILLQIPILNPEKSGDEIVEVVKKIASIK
ncbi:MAG: response regulator [Desulfotalea sp.]